MCVGFPRFLDKFNGVDFHGFAKEAPEGVGGVGDVIGGFHDYAFVFRFYGEFVADFYSEFGADVFGYGDLVFSGYFYFVLHGFTQSS